MFVITRDYYCSAMFAYTGLMVGPFVNLSTFGIDLGTTQSLSIIYHLRTM